MRIRRIAVLIDGGFFERRLPKLVDDRFHDTAQAVANSARFLCKRHVQQITGEPFGTQGSRWLDHVYRVFYYDAIPYEGKPHHPLLKQQIDFGKSATATFHRDLHNQLRRSRKFAVRLGKVVKESDWKISPSLTKKILRTREWLDRLDLVVQGDRSAFDDLTPEKQAEWRNTLAFWQGIGEHDVSYGLRQKGVDMRIGIDISSLTLKGQVDTIILVTGDSDFVPAAKLARREGVEFIVDPMWQSVNDDLLEHVDGIQSGFPRPDPNTGQVPIEGLNDEDQEN